MPNQKIIQAESQLMESDFPYILKLENVIRLAIKQLAQGSNKELQLKLITTAFENYAKEINKTSDNFVLENNRKLKKEKPIDLKLAFNICLMLHHVGIFLGQNFTALSKIKLIDPKLIEQAEYFIKLCQTLKTTHKQTFKTVIQEISSAQRVDIQLLSAEVSIRSYLLMAKQDSDFEYLENILISVITLNKIIQLAKNDNDNTNLLFSVELLGKKLLLVEYYFNKGHYQIAIDYLQKSIPLFKLLTTNQHPDPTFHKQLGQCKEKVTTFLTQFNTIVLKNRQRNFFILSTKLYQSYRLCIGLNDERIMKIDQLWFSQNIDVPKKINSIHFNSEVDQENRLIYFHFHEKYFDSSIFDHYQNIISWSYQDNILIIKNAHEIKPELFIDLLYAIHDWCGAEKKRLENEKFARESAKKLPSENSASYTGNSSSSNQNNNQTNTTTTNDNPEKKEKEKTKGTPSAEKETENAEQKPKPPNTYTARELHFFVPKQYENYVIRELTGADMPDGVFYGLYDFHPTKEDSEKLGMSDDQLTLYENKFDEAHLVTDSKTGIVITKDKDFYVDVYDPETTETDTPKVMRNIHIHTGLKVSIAAMDHRIEAEPLSATKTKEHTPILWRFFKPTTHKKSNIKLSSTNDSCNNNQTMREIKSDNNNAPK